MSLIQEEILNGATEKEDIYDALAIFLGGHREEENGPVTGGLWETITPELKS